MNKDFRLIFIILTFTLSYPAIAQLNYKDGFIITLQNDTLFGKINDFGGMKNAKVCLYKAGKNSKAVKYLPADIKAYRFMNGNYYKTLELFYRDNYQSVFSDVLLEGELNLYRFRKIRQAEFYISRSGGNLTGLINQEIAIRPQTESGGMPYEYGRLGYGKYMGGIILNIYKDTLMSLFKDSPKISEQVRFVDYEQKALVNITKAYLKETCRENCISYEKDFRASRETWGVFSGVQVSQINYLENIYTSKSTNTKSLILSNVKSDFIPSVPVGIFYNIPMSLINDRLSFQVELITTGLHHKEIMSFMPDSIDYVEINSRSVAIPVLFKYEVKQKFLSPSISVGKETSLVVHSQVTLNYDEKLLLNNVARGGWFYELGLNYKVSPKYSVFTNFRFQTSANLIIEEETTRATYSDAYDKLLFIKQFKTNTLSLYAGIKF